jgi:hypothetical protein
MKIYAYYQSIALSDQAEEFACANYWKQSWESNGWETVMLNKSHAQASGLYNKLSKKLLQTAQALPETMRARLDWIMARYFRWCALHAAGGGWMSDYDVFNKTFKPEDAEQCVENDTIFLNNDAPAYLFYATKEHAENAIKVFLNEPLIENNQLIEEAKILRVDKKVKKTLKKVNHIRCKPDKKRSQIMQEAAE